MAEPVIIRVALEPRRPYFGEIIDGSRSRCEVERPDPFPWFRREQQPRAARGWPPPHQGFAPEGDAIAGSMHDWTGAEQFFISALRQGAQVAQSVEQRTENPCVGGSIPPLGTIKS